MREEGAERPSLGRSPRRRPPDGVSICALRVGDCGGARRPPAQRAGGPLRERADGRPLVARAQGGARAPALGRGPASPARARGRPPARRDRRPTTRWSTRSTWRSIEARERVTRHDVKARIEEFSALAGHEQIHKGMTSRDLTENVEQLQVRAALVLVRDRMVTALARLAERAAEHADPRDDRPQPQRGRPGHDARQAVRQRRRGAAAGPPPRRRAARPLPVARHQGPGRHPAGPARPARRRPRNVDALEAAVARAPRLRRRAHQRRPGVPPLARPRRGRRAGAGGAPARRASPPPSASWPATSWPPRASSRARSARRPCPTR